MLAKWMKDKFHGQKDESDILASFERLVEDGCNCTSVIDCLIDRMVVRVGVHSGNLTGKWRKDVVARYRRCEAQFGSQSDTR